MEARSYVGAVCLDCSVDRWLAFFAAREAEVTARREHARRHRPRGYAAWNPRPETRLLSSCASHPDIPEFIRAEALEEERGRRLVSAGYPPADAAPFWPSSRQTTPSA